MLLNCVAVSPAISSGAADSVNYEFEDAAFTDDISVIEDSSASGGSYLKMEAGTITIDITADTAGLYDLIIYAGGIGGAKQQNMKLNGESIGTLSIPENKSFSEISIPAVKLTEGTNTLEIISSWGWSNFDHMTVRSASLPDIKATQTTTCDKDATAETQNLMSYLASVYGSHIITGQQEIYSYGPHGLETEFEYLNNLTGHYPAIRGFDYGNFTCPAFGSDDGSTERVIDWVKNKGGIATSSWHINVPNKMENYNVGDKIAWDQTSYSADGNDFSPSNAYTEGTKEYEYYLQALTTLAAEFKKLEAEGVPVIWRPLHEAEGGGGETGSWFWWGKEGSAVYKKLWIYTYNKLTQDFGCHNLIWEWNSYAFDTSADWYPGDEYVDIIGFDKYSCTKYLAENNWQPSLEHDASSYTSTFYTIMEKYNSAKMVSMAENDSFSTVDSLINDKAGWLYFCTWYDGGSDNINFLSNPIFNTEEDTIAMYQSDYAITLDELPANLYSEAVVTTTDPNATTVVTTTTTADPEATTTTTAYKFSTKKYTVTLPADASERSTMSVTIEGAPTASIGGALGYGTNADDWTNVEWSGNADSKGILTVEIDISDIPASITSAELQIWWSNTWNSATETSTDADCEMTDYSFPAPSELTTGADDKVYGDANGDGFVSVADPTLIMQAAANPDEYSIKDEDKPYADVAGNGDGVTSEDALAIQKFLSGSVESLPVTE